MVAHAYTAAGDRNFPPTLLLPQPAPADAFWSPVSTQPENAAKPGDATYETQLTGTYSKLITERLGIQLEYGLTRLTRLDQTPVTGAQNFHLVLQYEPVLDQDHEFLMSVQVDQEFGGTGTQSVGAFRQSATTPGITFAKGLGDLPIGYLRPLALTGFAGFSAAEGPTPDSGGGNQRRPNLAQAGLSIQYSIPYLLSKVTSLDLPSFLRGMTPMTELYFKNPVGNGYGNSTSVLVAPGVSYSQGTGWEAAIEATIPTTRTAGRGVGVIAQLVLQLDYLLAGSFFGRPIFAPR
ncbi:MAG: hypothetical protein JOZ17_01365 [Acetobacteraceae bacterium]|nr:hypothetical protein [Acetobacteraceae bacterium]